MRFQRETNPNDINLTAIRHRVQKIKERIGRDDVTICDLFTMAGQEDLRLPSLEPIVVTTDNRPRVSPAQVPSQHSNP